MLLGEFLAVTLSSRSKKSMPGFRLAADDDEKDELLPPLRLISKGFSSERAPAMLVKEGVHPLAEYPPPPPPRIEGVSPVPPRDQEAGVSPVPNNFDGVSSPSEKEGISTVRLRRKRRVSKTEPLFRSVSWGGGDRLGSSMFSRTGVGAVGQPARSDLAGDHCRIPIDVRAWDAVPGRPRRHRQFHRVLREPISPPSRFCKAKETHRTSPCRFLALLRASLWWLAVV